MCLECGEDEHRVEGTRGATEMSFPVEGSREQPICSTVVVIHRLFGKTS